LQRAHLPWIPAFAGKAIFVGFAGIPLQGIDPEKSLSRESAKTALNYLGWLIKPCVENTQKCTDLRK
jgi:hypothetical protein